MPGIPMWNICPEAASYGLSCSCDPVATIARPLYKLLHRLEVDSKNSTKSIIASDETKLDKKCDALSGYVGLFS